MKKRFGLFLLPFLASGLLLLNGCKDSAQSDAEQAENQTTSVGIQASLGHFEQNGGAFSVTGAMDAIDSMAVTVKDVSTDLVYQNQVAMTYANGKWNAIIENLPINANLSFSVDAYEQDSDSTADSVKTFSGITYKTLQGADSIAVSLASTQSNNVITMPQVYSVESAESIPVDVSTDVRFLLRGRNNATITYSIDSPLVGGSFQSKSGTIKLSGNSATLVIGYVASTSSLGTHKHTMRLTDDLGNQIRTTFKTTVVMGNQNSSGLIAQFAPRVKYIVMDPAWIDDPGANYIRLQLYLEDDKSTSAIKQNVVYEKDSSGDSSYIHSHTNCESYGYCWNHLYNYVPSTKGLLRFTVTDEDGLSTTVSSYVSENMFSAPNN